MIVTLKLQSGAAMALPPLVKQLVEKKIGKYCSTKIPEHVRDQIKLLYKIRGNNVTLFESRPSFQDHKKWVEIPAAQFRYNFEDNLWTLYCADRNSQWHEYLELDPSEKLDDLIAEVEEDPTGIFWG